MRIRTIVNMSALAALALAAHILESMLPPLLPFAPGVRMGLANIFTFLTLIFAGSLPALVVQTVRCLLGAVFGGSVSSLLYSLTAGLASYAVMTVLYTFCWRKLSLTGISLAASAVHNTVQVLVASLILTAPAVLYYLPYVLAVGSVCGIFTGAVTYFVVRYGGRQVYRIMQGKG